MERARLSEVEEKEATLQSSEFETMNEVDCNLLPLDLHHSPTSWFDLKASSWTFCTKKKVERQNWTEREKKNTATVPTRFNFFVTLEKVGNWYRENLFLQQFSFLVLKYPTSYGNIPFVKTYRKRVL